MDAQIFATYPWVTRRPKRHRRQNRDHFGFRETTEADREKITLWLGKKVCDYAFQKEPLQGEVQEKGEAIIVEADPSLTGNIINKITENNIEVNELRSMERTLEEIFMELTENDILSQKKASTV